MPRPVLQVADVDDVEAALRRVLREHSSGLVEAIDRAARPLRYADDWLREDVAAEYLGVATRTLADLRRSGVPFDTRERHRTHWYRRAGPPVDGRLSIQTYVATASTPWPGGTRRPLARTPTTGSSWGTCRRASL